MSSWLRAASAEPTEVTWYPAAPSRMASRRSMSASSSTTSKRPRGAALGGSDGAAGLVMAMAGGWRRGPGHVA